MIKDALLALAVVCFVGLAVLVGSEADPTMVTVLVAVGAGIVAGISLSVITIAVLHRRDQCQAERRARHISPYSSQPHTPTAIIPYPGTVYQPGPGLHATGGQDVIEMEKEA